MNADTATREAPSVLWRRLDEPGHDCARLSRDGGGWRMDGVAVFLHEDKACCLHYEVEIGRDWRTRSSCVRGWVGDRRIELVIAVDEAGEWSLNGAPAPVAAGCIDVDLAFTPATNLLPVRRLALPVGASQEIPAAWLTFPELSLERLDQTYLRRADLEYDYESLGGSFRARLQVLPSGFVRVYPGLWTIEG